MDVMTGRLKITLVKSMIGRPERQRRILRGMGLNRLQQTVELEDTAAIRGMVRKGSHLVASEEKKA
jgi:large subunit ribosomal protein L30